MNFNEKFFKQKEEELTTTLNNAIKEVLYTKTIIPKNKESIKINSDSDAKDFHNQNRRMFSFNNSNFFQMKENNKFSSLFEKANNKISSKNIKTNSINNINNNGINTLNLSNNNNLMMVNTLRSCESDHYLITENDKLNLKKINNDLSIENSPKLDLKKNLEEIKIKSINKNEIKKLDFSKLDDKNLIDSIFYKENKSLENLDKSNIFRNALVSGNAFNKLNNFKQRENLLHPNETNANDNLNFSKELVEKSGKDGSSRCKTILIYWKFFYFYKFIKKF